MTKNAPDDRDELRATAENPPTPESHPRTDAPDDSTRLKRRDHYDSELGKNGNKHRTNGLPETDGGSQDTNPGNDGQTSPLSTLFSEPEEVHAFVLGFAASSYVTAPEIVKQISALAGIGVAGSRLQKGFDDYKAQARAELPYFIAGAILGFVVFKLSPRLSGMGLGV